MCSSPSANSCVESFAAMSIKSISSFAAFSSEFSVASRFREISSSILCSSPRCSRSLIIISFWCFISASVADLCLFIHTAWSFSTSCSFDCNVFKTLSLRVTSFPRANIRLRSRICKSNTWMGYPSYTGYRPRINGNMGLPLLRARFSRASSISFRFNSSETFPGPSSNRRPSVCRDAAALKNLGGVLRKYSSSNLTTAFMLTPC
mmetsp:Transcript_20709/g.34673  ORF Transcript_20709/g.34673 Transcript_20709/m.34673 type:complete len:205 (+) Transcript_20709:2561-3175(+)